ncbi:MAG: mannose-1-phosphate guanylyltransferase [Sphingobacteriales bacterium]|jgi:mannose-1-phosphate guanylyltransferase
MNTNYYAVIMAGGIGSRFWPMSRASYPKQFLDILGTGKTFIQYTYERFKKICPEENILIVTHESYKGLIKEQLPNITDDQILCEPIARNTAPCIAYAAYKIASKNAKGAMVVAPSDHLILDEQKFIEEVETSLEYSLAQNQLVTLGIKPSRPDTGYGYIQFKKESEKSEEEFHQVKTFTEKPDLDLAKTFVKSGEFLWNSGIFVWSVKSILKGLHKHLPEIEEVFKDVKGHYYTPKEEAAILKAYEHCTNISIDYGLMEKATNVMVKPVEFGWSDLGTWGSLQSIIEKDYLGNAAIGKNIIIYDSTDCIIKASDDKLIVAQGLKDFIVVDTKDALLICKTSKEQDIKKIVADVKKMSGDKFS